MQTATISPQQLLSFYTSTTITAIFTHSARTATEDKHNKRQIITTWIYTQCTETKCQSLNIVISTKQQCFQKSHKMFNRSHRVGQKMVLLERW